MEGQVNNGYTNDDDNNKITKRNSSSRNNQNPSTEEQIEIELVEGNVRTNQSEDNFEKINEKTYDFKILADIETFFILHKKKFYLIFIIILNLLLWSYFAYATYYYEINGGSDIGWCNGYGLLVLLYGIIYFLLIYYKWFKSILLKVSDNKFFSSLTEKLSFLYGKLIVKLVLLAIVVIAFGIFFAIDTNGSRYRLRSLGSIAIIFIIGVVFSNSPKHINWRPVIFGFILQFLLGIICIRWDVGRSIFECFGGKVETFLNYSLNGSSFVFGGDLTKIFAFGVLPVIFFFSFFISSLYYLGAMQWFLLKLGWMLQMALGTTVCESVTAAANIFLGMSESPLLIRPYIKLLTHSEIHAVMTSGFATVSGTVLAAFINYGAEPAHLITASVMAAPAALCYSKLFYPETEKSKTTSDNMEMEKSTDSSLLDAASNGAMIAIPIVLSIIANLVSFVSFIAFINGVMGFFGELVGLTNFDLTFIFRNVFKPVAYIIGVEWDQSEYVGELIATKMVINEFVAYEKLGQFKNQTLISGRSAAIATFSICGFANPSSLGIMVGSLSALAAERRPAITKVAFRAFISGTFVCLLTASIAGLLLSNDMFE